MPEGRLIGRCAQIYFLRPDGTPGEIRIAAGIPDTDYTLPRGSLLLGCRIPLSRRPPAEIHKRLQRTLKVKKAAEPLALASMPRPLGSVPV